jgi:cysteine-rich repeat protein
MLGSIALRAVTADDRATSTGEGAMRRCHSGTTDVAWGSARSSTRPWCWLLALAVTLAWGGPASAGLGSCGPDGTPCDDQNACTRGDWCLAGTCAGGPAFLVGEHGRLGNAAQVMVDVAVAAAAGRLGVGRRAHGADGTRISADHVRLGVGADVDDLTCDTLNDGAGRATVRGTLVTAATFPLLTAPCALPPLDCGGPDVTVDRGETLSLLAPGSYGMLTLHNGATLTLAPGTFAFCAVRAGRRATITALATAPPAPTTIDVQGDLRMANGSSLGPGPGGPLPVVNVAGEHVRLARGSAITVVLTAPAATVKLGADTIMNGSACARRLLVGPRATLACASSCGDALLGPGEGCDDGNTTSGDGCSPACLVECGATTCAPGEICLGDQCVGIAP